ncbi:MAG TPA: hypothetical protein VNN73_16750 [Blastocatellia bacterium]|nr:hypothetical protein [Blastocatellia bacterium]
MHDSQKDIRVRGEAGLGLMEAIVATLVVIIVGSVLLQLAKQGIAAYRLSSATSSIAGMLEKARDTAKSMSINVRVIFDAKGNRFGLDRNGNSKLDSIEVEELPTGISLSEDAVVVFTKKGDLARGSEPPRINISNNHSTRIVTVSSMGSIDIE